MILQALVRYYDRKVEEGEHDLEPEGYKRVDIPFLIVIRKDGSFVDIDDTRNQAGRRPRARSFIVPKVFEGSRTVNVQANLLWDKASYIFGESSKTGVDPLRLDKQRKKFHQKILEYFQEFEEFIGVSAVLSFLDNHTESVKKHSLWAEFVGADPNLAFRLEGENELVCCSSEVKQALIEHNGKDTDKCICLITGRTEIPARLENPIKGLNGSGKAESHFVSFNESAYWSYGKNKDTRQKNAPIGKSSSAAYVAAVNYLQRNHFLKVGDASTLFWAEKKHIIKGRDFEDVFADIFGEPAKDNPVQDYKALVALFRAPQIGAKAELDPGTRFYVLGLAPNAARIAVRFWYEGTVAQVSDNIYQHFEDCTIVHGPNQPKTLSLFRLLVSTATQGESKNIQPKLTGDFMRAILTGTPYPKSVLAAVINRTKAEQSKKDQNGKSIQNVTYPRAALIKAVLVRESRYYKHNMKEVDMALDTSNDNIGYRMGRLFATLEKIQEEASPGINATIRDRFYGAASSTPVTVFSHLMKLKNHHLSKLGNRGRAVNFERLIGEIIDDINDFPSHLSLADQGRFAVGYYHQRQDFFTK